MKYIKTFQTHSAYNTYISGQDKMLPNVSYCEDNDEVHYNPWIGITAKYNITSTSGATTIMTGLTPNVSKMFIDGVEQESVVSSYTFDTTGEHTISFELIDNTVISAGAFTGCTGLTSITIPNSVTSIGQSAFGACTDLTSINIPNSITTIGNSAFNNCTSLTSITIPSSVTSIGQNVFYQCTGLTSINIPNGVTAIGDSAFSGCSGLTSVTIGSGLTSIGSQVFFQCSGLTSLTIGSGVTSIGDTTFLGCTGLTSITIPSSVTTISSYAFSGCTNLINVTVEATTPPSLGSNVFAQNASGRKIYVPSASVATYKAASGWSGYASDIEAIPSA